MPNQRRNEEKEEDVKELTSNDDPLLEEIKNIYDLMVENSLMQLTVEKKENKFFLRRAGKNESAAHHHHSAVHPSNPVVEKEEVSNFVTVKSPLIGVFYSSPGPEAKPFVVVGDNVDKGSPLCIVEAMKVMNEIPSPVRGKIIKVLGVNGKSVQTDQDIFLLQPLEE